MHPSTEQGKSLLKAKDKDMARLGTAAKNTVRKLPCNCRPLPGRNGNGMDGLGQVLVVQSGGETQEHLFKECGGWKGEIHTLWKKVGDISGERKDYKDGGGSTPKSGKTSALTMLDRGIHPSETYQETGRLRWGGGSGKGRTKMCLT